jgi:anti-sigma B factor antagonist
MLLDFSIDIEEKNNFKIFKISGEIDVYTAPKLKETLIKAVEEICQQECLILNLNDVQYIDSTGIGTIAYIARLLTQTNKKIHIIYSLLSIKKIFDVSGLTKKNIFLFEKEEQALIS